MFYIGLLLTGVFLILSAIHVYWAFGGEAGKTAAIPVKEDGQQSFTPSKVATLAVAVALFLFAVLVFCIAIQNVTMLRPLGWGLAFVLFLRAIGDFNLVGFFKRPSVSVFARNDSRFYSPLCLLLAAGILYISL
ncbi:DUF3995 domain-containing protein [Pseudochrobactrum sp. sp1633]|uniref:DUF3995 domain-containing protein n=1 Tax=Pseudochrobactrum sp. sp1633 TaxID=3036706 RepID=UPI0025A5CFE8|nr:DUF3995 domain-containing protein [Pseudochrobactrum sp. sp1633]MDM8345262.1 DUF3995 domain-containing protein [Pseudochrobactrum sp. sp1633]HWD12887.1 DUF3995 domain-containing protein [Pseudochrobactrum sp.]